LEEETNKPFTLFQDSWDSSNSLCKL
jgi:hypothetical protein